MDWYEGEFNQQTLIVYEDVTRAHSKVLDSRGEPFIISTNKRFGFDLQPKMKDTLK